MGASILTDEDLVRTQDALRQTMRPNGTYNVFAASKLLGITNSAMQNRVGKLPRDDVQFPQFPPDDIPIGQVIEQATQNFEKLHSHTEAKRWFPIRIASDAPIGIAFIGDPHLDSPGCNWPMLRSHVSILAATPGLYSVNIGDVADNWVGRLVRLHASSHISDKRAKELIRWFFSDSGIKWICHVLGNHDAWNEGATILRLLNVPAVPMEDWQARFKLVFPCGRECRIWASHHFKGNSIWNPGHGSQRAAQLRDSADIYASGHIHNWFIQQQEHERGFVYTLLRARGYKFIDSYADVHGFESAKFGATVVSIIDPLARDGAGFVQTFPCMESGADYLTYLRGRKCPTTPTTKPSEPPSKMASPIPSRKGRSPSRSLRKQRMPSKTKRSRSSAKG